jgi:hypothetical protein
MTDGGITIYNLFSNCIDPYPFDYLRKFIPNFNRGGIITYIKQQVNLLLECEDMEIFYSLLKDVFNICT